MRRATRSDTEAASRAEILARCTDQLRRLPLGVSRQEDLAMAALGACREASTEEKDRLAKKALLEASDRIRCVFVNLPSPETLESLQRLLEAHDALAAERDTSGNEFDEFRRSIHLSLFLTIDSTSAGSVIRWSLDDWRTWFKAADNETLTFTLSHDPTVYCFQADETPRGRQENSLLPVPLDSVNEPRIFWAAAATAMLVLGGWLLLRQKQEA